MGSILLYRFNVDYDKYFAYHLVISKTSKKYHPLQSIVILAEMLQTAVIFSGLSVSLKFRKGFVYTLNRTAIHFIDIIF